MAASKFFSVTTAIRVMILGGLLAILFVIVQSCQVPKIGIESYAMDGMRKLTALSSPPEQPTMTFTSADGVEMQLTDYRGQVVLLNVWATWCPPCVAEMPTLSELQAEQGGHDFQVVTISMDRTAQEAADWLADKGLDNLPAYHDGSYSLSGKLGARGLPISIIYDRQGQEIARVVGDADWMGSEAQALIKYVTE